MTSLPNSAESVFIDYDLNIFMKEVEDPNTEEYYYDPTSWMVHVYAVDGAGHHEVADPYPLSPEEIRSLGLNNDEYFEGGDCWYGMYGYLNDYSKMMPESLLAYLSSFPKYKELPLSS